MSRTASYMPARSKMKCLSNFDKLIKLPILRRRDFMVFYEYKNSRFVMISRLTLQEISRETFL